MSTKISSAPQERPLSMITANQMIISGGNFTLSPSEVPAPSDHRKAIYESFKDHIIPNAAHDADDPAHPWPRCDPNTYTTILESLENQGSSQDRSSSLICISGGPASSKSSIAGSLCDILQAKGQLGASFRFSQSRLAGEFDISKCGFVATIAFHLAISLPGMQPYIAAALVANPFIFYQAPRVQMEELVARPLLACKLDAPTTIIVDGLDKYGDIAMQHRMLSALCEAAARMSGMLKIIIFTRPLDPHIIDSDFESELSIKPITTFNLEGNNNKPATGGVEKRAFLEAEIQRLHTLHGLSSGSDSQKALTKFLTSSIFNSLDASESLHYAHIALKYMDSFLPSSTESLSRTVVFGHPLPAVVAFAIGLSVHLAIPCFHCNHSH